MTLDKSPETIQTMFNMISGKYDLVNQIMSLGTQKYIKQSCIKLLDIKPNTKVLDLCCGTGDLGGYAKKYRPDADIIGVDFSDKMIEIAKNRNNGVKYFKCNVTQLPFDDATFDIAVMGFGLRNVQNREKAIEEVYRILKPGGIFLHIDFGEKNLPSKIFDIFVPVIVKFISDDIYAYNYLIKSKREFPCPNDLIKIFEANGFKFERRKDYILKAISCQIMSK